MLLLSVVANFFLLDKKTDTSSNHGERVLFHKRIRWVQHSFSTGLVIQWAAEDSPAPHTKKDSCTMLLMKNSLN